MKTKLLIFSLFATLTYLTYMFCTWAGETNMTAAVFFGVMAVASLFAKVGETE